MANLPPCLIGVEACAGAHHLDRRLVALGHDVRLIPAQYVRPFRKGHQNDYRDAEAIAEAVQRPTMRFVQSRAPNSSIFRRSIAFGAGLFDSARRLSASFAASCWSVGLLCPKGRRGCTNLYQRHVILTRL